MSDHIRKFNDWDIIKPARAPGASPTPQDSEDKEQALYQEVAQTPTNEPPLDSQPEHEMAQDYIATALSSGAHLPGSEADLDQTEVHSQEVFQAGESISNPFIDTSAGSEASSVAPEGYLPREELHGVDARTEVGDPVAPNFRDSAPHTPSFDPNSGGAIIDPDTGLEIPDYMKPFIKS